MNISAWIKTVLSTSRKTVYNASVSEIPRPTNVKRPSDIFEDVKSSSGVADFNLSNPGVDVELSNLITNIKSTDIAIDADRIESMIESLEKLRQYVDQIEAANKKEEQIAKVG